MTSHLEQSLPQRRRVLSPLRYPGGKRRMVPFIAASLMQNDCAPGVFVEPFAGGASVSLELLDLGLVNRIVLGDSDPFLAAFWQTVMNDSDWLCSQIESVPLNLETWERLKRGHFRARRSLALACLFLNRTSFNGTLHRTAGPIGGKTQAGPYKIDCRFPRSRLISRIRACAELAERVEVAPAQDAMTTVRTERERARKAGDSVFFYLDPPFWSKSASLYQHAFSETDHERLADGLQWINDPFLLSYDPAPEIVDLYTGHSAATVAEIELLYAGSGSVAGAELVISNLSKLPARTRLWRTSKEWSDLRRGFVNDSYPSAAPAQSG